MKVLVTGASGFLGGHLIEELVRKGYNVIGMVRKDSSRKLLKELNVSLRFGDLLEPESLVDATRDVDVVVHLAAYYTFFGKKELYEKINVQGTRFLLEAMNKNSVKRIVYCSTTEAVGPVKEPYADEDVEPNPVYEYGKSKLRAGNVVKEYGSKGIDYTILRPSGIYGPRNVNDVSYWFITGFAKNSLTSKFIVGSGNNLVQFAHVKDVVQGFVLALEKYDIAKDRTYFVSEDKAYTYNEVYEMLAEVCGRKPPKTHVPPMLAKIMIAPIEFFNRIFGIENFNWHVSTVDAVTCDRAYSIERIKRELGYSPKYDLKKGLKETVEWYRENSMI
ncbi:MAG: NAD-dependent epimerase/dehydratase family protein [Nitrososphaeria archaeon]